MQSVRQRIGARDTYTIEAIIAVVDGVEDLAVGHASVYRCVLVYSGSCSACRWCHGSCTPVQVLSYGEVRTDLFMWLLVGYMAERLAKISASLCGAISRGMLLEKALLVLRNDRFSGLLAFINHDLLAL